MARGHRPHPCNENLGGGQRLRKMMPMLLRRAVVDGDCADEAAMNMLLEIPTGLHFTGVRIYAAVNASPRL